MGNKVAILNQKGGVGKTTTAINLGSYLAKNGKKVLLVDFDPQGNATGGLNLDKQGLDTTVYDVIINGADVSKVVRETNISNLYILPSNASLAAAEVELAGSEQRETKLRHALENLAYDHILIDCPPSLGLLSINALTAADSVLIPVQAEYYAMEGLTQLLDVVQRVRSGLNTQLELLGVVITMFDNRTSLSDQVAAEVRKYFGDKVFETVVPRNVRLAEAPSHGKSIIEHDKWSKGARAYKQLTKEVVNRLQVTAGS